MILWILGSLFGVAFFPVIIWSMVNLIRTSGKKRVYNDEVKKRRFQRELDAVKLIRSNIAKKSAANISIHDIRRVRIGAENVLGYERWYKKADVTDLLPDWQEVNNDMQKIIKLANDIEQNLLKGINLIDATLEENIDNDWWYFLGVSTMPESHEEYELAFRQRRREMKRKGLDISDLNAEYEANKGRI